MDRSAIDVLEELHAEVEQIEALAHTLADAMQDVRLPAGEQARRFTRLVGLLADRCEEVRAEAGQAIGRVTARSRERRTNPIRPPTVAGRR